MHATLEKLLGTVESTLRGLDAHHLQRRPGDDPARWSGQQIVEHLLLTYSLSGANFESRLGKGTPTAAKASLGQRFGQMYVCTLGLFPPGRKSPTIAEPPQGASPMTGAELIDKVSQGLKRFDEAAVQGERQFGSVPAFSHPVLGPMNVANWRRFHLVHGLHHMKQIRAIAAEAGGQVS